MSNINSDDITASIWRSCVEARRKLGGAARGGELIMSLAECDGYVDWLHSLGIRIPPNWEIFEPFCTHCAASMLAFSDPVPISLLYNKALNESCENDAIKFVLNEIWCHYTLPSILEQAKTVLQPRTQLVANRFLNVQGVDKEKMSKAVHAAVKTPWQCGLYSSSTRVIMGLAHSIGIQFVALDKNTEDPSIGIVCIGHYRFGTTIRGKALLTLIVALWQSQHSDADAPASVAKITELLQIQN